MAKSQDEVALAVENSEEKLAQVVSTIFDSNPSANWPTTKEIHVARESLHRKWTEIFVASCLFAVLLDPLFLYIPMIKDDMKCMMLDKNLKIAALTLRSFTDLFYIMDIIYQIYRSENFTGLTDEFRCRNCSKLKFLWSNILPKIAKTIWRSYNIFIDILAILPLPQVVILIFFEKMRDLSSLNATMVPIMNVFALSQYVPRVLRIYLSCKELKRTPNKGKIGETAIWVKGVLNFFMYVLVSHVLGAIWYFFAIQRTAVCWHSACQKGNRCGTSTFGCHDQDTSRNMTFLNDLCPISPSNTTLFDFGIFTSILQSGIPGSTNYYQKFSNCFWWGLRNLSSLGSNLQPSIDASENLFAAFISIIGLLLFLYLIGNLQTYMQLDTTRIEAHRYKKKLERKMEEKGREIELWLSKNGIPSRLNEKVKLRIMGKVREELEENMDTNLENLISILPSDLQTYIKSCMPLTKMKQVPMFQSIGEIVLKVICQHLKPMKYTKNEIIIQEKERLQMMLFIVDGLVRIEKRDCQYNSERGPGELCGEELLGWPSLRSFPKVLPLATESAKAIDDVEALVLMASDMESIGSRFKWQFTFQRDYLGRRYKTFTEKELEKATNNYHVSSIIGQGGSGNVYKGVLPDKTVIVVKRMTNTSHQGEMVYNNEVIVASLTNHRNLVRFLGCCLNSGTPMLVFEYISNGDLYEHIHIKDGQRSPPLSFELRMKIAAEIAGALVYLHSLTPDAIIHRDVKSKNILLDDIYTAKLCDFGISKLISEAEDYISTNVKGTFGYLDPDYMVSEQLTRESDVYGFGIVLAELLTSRVAISRSRPRAEMNLASFLVESVEGDNLHQILDGEIINEGDFETAKKVAHLAKRCLSSERTGRPSMKEVAEELEGLRSIMAEHAVGNANFSPFSNAYDVDVTSEGDDQISDIIW